MARKVIKLFALIIELKMMQSMIILRSIGLINNGYYHNSLIKSIQLWAWIISVYISVLEKM